MRDETRDRGGEFGLATLWNSDSLVPLSVEAWGVILMLAVIGAEPGLRPGPESRRILFGVSEWTSFADTCFRFVGGMNVFAGLVLRLKTGIPSTELRRLDQYCEIRMLYLAGYTYGLDILAYYTASYQGSAVLYRPVTRNFL